MMTALPLFDLESVAEAHLESVTKAPFAQQEHHTSGGDIPSLLKWTGSKRSQAARIVRFAPSHKRYYEPFLGGGAMLYLLGHTGAIAGDLYGPLVAFWEMVRDKPEVLADNYADQWHSLQADFPGYFYLVRDRFNETRRAEDLNFLMRTCVNGIVRFSRKGEFNNSFHLSRKGMLPKKFRNIVRIWNERLAGVIFRQGDYVDTLGDAGAGDFVYMDPPYAGNKQRYIGDLDVSRFLTTLESLNQRGVKWALSFDGQRGDTLYNHDIPRELFHRKELLRSGYSAVSKVLNGPIEMVTESLYLNY